MAGTPSKSDSRVVKDFGKPRKFLSDMRAKAAKNSRKRASKRSGLTPETALLAFAPRLLSQ